MAATATAADRTVRAPAVDPRLERSKPDAIRFVLLAVQLALLFLVFEVYSLQPPPFTRMAFLVFGGAAMAYWLPFRFKEPFVIALSLAGAYVLLSAQVASLLIAAGLLLFGIVRSGLAFRWRVGLLLAVLGVAVYGRATGAFDLPGDFWPVFGAIFMFRMIVYVYDAKHLRGPASLKDFLGYFFLLPNYYFLLFPVIDFQTFRSSYFKRNIHDVAQQGIWWILRGTTHLLLYRIVYQLHGRITPDTVPVPAAVVGKIILTYLLYLQVTGQFHIIAGMMHLFGYDLPETNRRYLLARSMNDFWRRANIYWKDFMVKIVYFPAYFKLRRGGEGRAEVLGTVLVVMVTWFLHGYQFFWLKGAFRFTANDSLFWAILGSVMVANVWIERARPKRAPAAGWRARLRTAAQIAGTFALIAILWSMWSADGLSEWLIFLRTGYI